MLVYWDPRARVCVCVCVCPPDSKIKYSVFFVYSCSCIIILCYFTFIFYAVVRQISMLFIDNKDSVFCVCVGGGGEGTCARMCSSVHARVYTACRVHVPECL